MPIPALPPTMTSRPPAASQRAQRVELLRRELVAVDVLPDEPVQRRSSPRPGSGRSATEQRHDRRAAAPNGFGGRLICETRACGRSAMTPTTSCVASWTRYATSTLSMTWSFDDELDLHVPPECRRLGVEDVDLARAGREVDGHREPGVALRAAVHPQLALDRRARRSGGRPRSRPTSRSGRGPGGGSGRSSSRTRRLLRSAIGPSASEPQREQRRGRTRRETSRTRPFASRDLLELPVPSMAAARRGVSGGEPNDAAGARIVARSAPDFVDFVAGLLPGAAPIVRFPPVPSIRPFRALRYSRELRPRPVDGRRAPVRRDLARGAPAPARPRPAQRRPRWTCPRTRRATRPTSATGGPRSILSAWRSDGTLRRDPRPALYPYEQTYTIPGTDRTATRRGVFARVVPGAVRAGERHARARAHARRAARGPLPAAPGDGRQHQPGRRARRGRERVRGRTGCATTAATRPIVELVDDDGVGHRLWIAAVGEDDGARRGDPPGDRGPRRVTDHARRRAPPLRDGAALRGRAAPRARRSRTSRRGPRS